MDLLGFVNYCETPGVGATGKGTSYRNAIQYLCDYLGINILTFSSDDLALIKSKSMEISNSRSCFYRDFLNYLSSRGRKSYLTGGFIKAALPYFYAYYSSRR